MMQLGIQAFLPAVIVSIGSVVLMMQIAFWRRPSVSLLITCATLLLATWAILPASEIAPRQVTILLRSDSYSLYYTALMALAGLVTAMVSRDYLEHRQGENEEFYLLLLLATLGAMVLVSATHFASFLLGLELLGVSIYPLIAYAGRHRWLRASDSSALAPCLGCSALAHAPAPLARLGRNVQAHARPRLSPCIGCRARHAVQRRRAAARDSRASPRAARWRR